MDRIRILQPRKSRRWFCNPHFWAIAVIFIGTSLLYYSIPLLPFRPEWLRHLEIFEMKARFHGSLLCIPIIYTAVAFWWRGALIMWLISVFAVAPLAFYYKHSLSPLLVNVFYLCIPLIIIGSIALELNWREKEKRALLEREEERRLYVAQIFKAEEDERKRIAQELHDDTIHALLLTAKRMQNMAGNGNSQIEGQLKEESREILRISDDLRRLTIDLRPSILDNVGFTAALRWLVDRLYREGQIDVKLVVKGEDRKIPRGVDVILVRIVQEALNNIRLHSEATQATVNVEFGTENMKIIVYDNGKGFTLPKRINSLASKGKLGLIGMQERAYSIKGTYRIRSKPGLGTRITVECKL